MVVFVFTIYLLAFIISFTSFYSKKDLQFHISLYISFSFFVWLFLSFIKLINFNIHPQVLNSLDVFAVILLFYSIAKIRSISIIKPSIIKRKIFNILLLLIISIIIIVMSYSLINDDIVMTKFITNIINAFFTLLISIHLPIFKEYKYFKLATFMFFIKYILIIFNIYAITSFIDAIALTLIVYNIIHLYYQKLN